MSKNYAILKVPEDKIGLKNIRIQEINLVNSKVVEIIVYFDLLNISKEVIEEIEAVRNIISKIEDNVNIEFNINKYDKKLKEEDIEEAISFLLEYVKNEDKYLNMIVNEINYSFINDSINIVLGSLVKINHDKIMNFISNLSSKLWDIFELRYEIDVTSNLEDSKNFKFKPREVKVNFEKEVKKEIRKSGFDTKVSYVKPKLDITPLGDVSSMMINSEILVRGEVFKIELKEIKNSKIIVEIYITDNENSVICDKFINNKEELKVKVGDIIEGLGIYQNYREKYSIRLKKIDIIGEAEDVKKDSAKVKRIELAAHTNMSDMTSTIDSKELIERAKYHDHKAIAVTDYGVVHAFPFVAHGVKKNEDFKIIYGIEAYVVDDEAPLIKNPKDIYIEEEEFVIFDIETTGFSSTNDKIIEIGAVKMKRGLVIDKFSEFINPEIKIPMKIVELTGISDKMVSNAETIEKVLPRFLEFIKNTTVVAHNAKFDVGFITKKCEQLNLSLESNFSFIDTLEWAKILVKDIKRYSLDALTKKFNIVLENHHRAIDDAQATAEVFKVLLKYLSPFGIERLTQVSEKLFKEPIKADTENVTILVKNLKGLKRLYELVSISHIKYYGDKKPRILKSDLSFDRENFLISSSPIYSGRFNKGKLVDLYIRGMSKDDISEAMDFYDYVQIYPDSIYNDAITQQEISGIDFIHQMNKDFVEMAKSKNKLVVATGNVYYLDKKDRKSKAALLLGSDRAFNTYDIDTGNYFRTTDEMLNEFSYLGKDVEDVVIYNTHKIEEQIEKIKPIPDGEYRPVMEGAEDSVRDMSYNRVHELYGEKIPPKIEERLERELNAIIGNGFSVLYLIAQKLVKKSVDNGHIVGSRGSVGSSLVAYLMGITEVNGLYPHYRCPKCKYFEMKDFEGSGVDLEEKKCPNCETELIRDGHSIPFEVFMGFKGDKTPDIDLNFSGEYQGEIHKYTKELFGEDYVFRAGTITTVAEKNAIAYSKKYFEENIKRKFESKVLSEYNTSLKKLDSSLRAEKELELKNMQEEFCNKNSAEIERIAKKCEGARKTTGQHPGGMIVVPNYKSIYDFTPVQYPANDPSSGSITTHFDYHVMDTQLTKLDILGHDDPSTLKMLRDLTGVDIYNIPLTDPKVISIFSSTEALGVTEEEIGNKLGTSGIPEFGTEFVKQMLEDTLPKTFSELVRISGLSHGTDVWLNNAQEYVRNGVATLSEIITVRDDIINHLIDMGLDKSDAFNIMEFVRKGRPSKPEDKEAWEEYKKKMKANNVKDWYIESCEKIKYMFPKGHAVAYVMMAVRIAYFKVYYPLEFYTAYLNRKADDFSFIGMNGTIEELRDKYQQKKSLPDLSTNDKKSLILMEILIEMKARGIELLDIDIYESEAHKFKIENGKIRIPLSAMDQLGEVVANTIVEERNKGKFSSIEDISKRCKISKTVLDNLRKYKCIDDDLPESDQLTLF